MIATFQSELIKVWQRRTVLTAVVVAVVFAASSAALVLVSAESGAVGAAGRGGGGVTVESLSGAGGGTEVFASAMAFAGFFVLVLFTGAMAAEFGRGSFRTMLLAQPSRLRLLAGKLGALLASAAVVLALVEVVTWVTARLLAPSQDIATGDWASFAGLGAGIADYGSSLFWVTGYALLGTALAMVVRSVTVAMAIGLAWFGPFEHILADGWDLASQLFPGLLLEQVIAGGSPDVSATQAFTTVLAYAAVAAVIAGTSFARRDVT
ncbi:hypothetical protein BH20ACT2_BH20ACT2_05590 [soil metagenome]